MTHMHTIPPLDPELSMVTLPLHQCPPRAILQELHETWGNACSPPTDDEGLLPVGWTRIAIGGDLRYYSQEDMAGMLSDLDAVLVKHDAHTKGAKHP